ncbi:hypothetical protein AB0L68_36560 [Streptomyces sp. NPDC052164]|uniref:hypothetical protein n=1 Tax=Streptomyces sp. NPDC052164 TaxID=3155529 RepID=UPI003415B1B0
MSTPDPPQRLSRPIPNVLIVIEEHTTTDDDLEHLLRIARSRPRHPGMIVSTTATGLSRG